MGYGMFVGNSMAQASARETASPDGMNATQRRDAARAFEVYNAREALRSESFNPDGLQNDAILAVFEFKKRITLLEGKEDVQVVQAVLMNINESLRIHILAMQNEGACGKTLTAAVSSIFNISLGTARNMKKTSFQGQKQ